MDSVAQMAAIYPRCSRWPCRSIDDTPTPHPNCPQRVEGFALRASQQVTGLLPELIHATLLQFCFGSVQVSPSPLFLIPGRCA